MLREVQGKGLSGQRRSRATGGLVHVKGWFRSKEIQVKVVLVKVGPGQREVWSRSKGGPGQRVVQVKGDPGQSSPGQSRSRATGGLYEVKGRFRSKDV